MVITKTNTHAGPPLGSRWAHKWAYMWAEQLVKFWYMLPKVTPRLPVDVEFGLQRGSQKGSPGESNYVSQLKRRFRFAHKKAKHMAKRQQARHRELYDLNCRGAALEEGDLVLVKQTTCKGGTKSRIGERVANTR